MNIALSQTDKASLIHLEGAIDIGAASELKAALLEARKAGKGTAVTLGALSELDVTAFQLLWAAKREAKQAGRGFELAQLPAYIQASLAEMGLDANQLSESAE
jgi:anti-anti-sigma regulatory factor